MSDSNQVEKDERRRLLFSQEIDAAFGDHFDILTKLERKPKRFTAKDKAKYEAAKTAVEKLAAKNIDGLDEARTKSLSDLRTALNGAKEFADSAAAVQESEKPKKAERPSADEIRERRRAEREIAEAAREEAVEEPPARDAEGATPEPAPEEEIEQHGVEERYNGLPPLREIAGYWKRILRPLENREARARDFFHTFTSQKAAIAHISKFNADLRTQLGTDMLNVLDRLGLPEEPPVDEVPDDLRPAVSRYMRLVASGAQMLAYAERYDDYLVERRAAIETQAREAEPVARTFTQTAQAMKADIERILALPHESLEERFVSRGEVESFAGHLTAYNDDWKRNAVPNLPDWDVEVWLPFWEEAKLAHDELQEACKPFETRQLELAGFAAQDWEVNRTRFDGKLAVLRTRIIEAQRKEGDDRIAELEGIRTYYETVRDEWRALIVQAPRELQEIDQSPVKKLDGVVLAIGRDIEGLLNEKDAQVMQAQEAYGALGHRAVRAYGFWNPYKRLAQRSAFLHRYLENKVKSADPEFGEYVTNREVFTEVVAPLAAAYDEITDQASRIEREERRPYLRHWWLSNLRAEDAKLEDGIVARRFWKKETTPEERLRLVEAGEDIADDDPALIAAVRSVRRDVQNFRQAIAELKASKQATTAFEDRLLAKVPDLEVVIDVNQLHRLGREYGFSTGDEYEKMERILALDGWKIADREDRRKAVGEYWRRPIEEIIEKMTDSPDAFRWPLKAWYNAVEQKLKRRHAFGWALEANRELIPNVGKLSPSAQRIVDIVLANANRQAPEPVPVPAPEALDARNEAIRDRRSEIGNLLAEDIFWDRKVRQSMRLARINVMLNHGRAEARLHSDFGLRNKADFYDAAGFTDFADLETRMARIRNALIVAAPTVDAAVAAAASAPAAAGTPAVPAIRNVVPAPVSAPTPAVVARPPAPAPSAAIPRSSEASRSEVGSRLAPTPPAPSRPAAIAAPAVAAVAATSAAGILNRLTSRIEARRAEGTAPGATGSVPPPLPAMERAGTAATAGSPEADRGTAPAPIAAPTPEQAAPRAAPASVRAALPPAPTLVRRGEPAPVIGAAAIIPRSSEASRSEVGSHIEPAPTGAPAPIDAARVEPVVGGVESVAPSASRLAPTVRPPMRRELPPPPELTNEVRVSSWAKSIRSTVGRWFGRDLGDYVASELTGEQMERERRNEAMSRPEAMARTVSSLLGIAGRTLGFQSFVDVPRYFTQSFMKENERAFLRAGILEAMEHEALGREGDRQRASLEASTRLERAINTSAHLTSEQKAEMVTRVNTMRVTYQERSFAVAEARSIALTELIEANVQAKVNGWRAAKETVNSALAVLSFGGAPLVAGVSYGAARGVSYLAMSLQEKYVAAAVQNPRASWVGKAQAAFRDTLTSTWNRLSARTETVGQRFMNAVDALAEIGNAVGVQTGPAISGLERSLPALRSLEGSTDSGIAQIVANARQAIQATIDRILPVFERLTARKASTPVTI